MTKKSIHVKLDEDKLKALKIWCIHNNTDVSEVVAKLIETFLSENLEEHHETT